MLEMNFVRALRSNIEMLGAAELWMFSSHPPGSLIPVVMLEQLRSSPENCVNEDNLTLQLNLATDCRRLFKKLLKQVPDRAGESRLEKQQRLCLMLCSVGFAVTIETHVPDYPGRVYLTLGFQRPTSKSAPAYAVLIDLAGASNLNTEGELACTTA